VVDISEHIMKFPISHWSMTVNSSQKRSVQLKCLQLCITNSMQCKQFLSFSRVHPAYNSATNRLTINSLTRYTIIKN